MSNTLEGSSAEGHAMGIVDVDRFSDYVVVPVKGIEGVMESLRLISSRLWIRQLKP
jgi:hypothetical protein